MNNKDEIKDAEFTEAVVETKNNVDVIKFGGAGLPESFASDEEMELAIKEVERRNTFIERVTKLALKTLLPQDFHDFNGTPLLQGIGAQRLIKYFGISIINFRRYPVSGYETIKEDTANRLRVTYRADFLLGKMQVPGEGRRDTHNQFLCKTSAGYRELKDINLPNLDASAKTALYRDGIETLLGLKGLSWEYLKELGFTPDKTTGHTYKKGTQGGDAAGNDPKTKELKTKIGDMLLEIAEGEKDGAADILEELTAWTKDGKAVKGKRELSRLTEKQSPVIYGKVKEKYDAFLIGRDGTSADKTSAEPVDTNKETKKGESAKQPSFMDDDWDKE